jgi:hypothetical protein
MSLPRKAVATKPPASRSRVTNGSRVHQTGDERSSSARRFRDLIESFSTDLGELSEADMAMVRTAATLTLKMELIQADLVAGKEVESDQLIRMAGTVRRSLAAISAKAAAKKPSGPTLAEYWSSKADDEGDE